LQPHPQTRIWQFSSGEAATTLTGFEPAFGISLIRAITGQRCSNQHVNCTLWKSALCTNRAE